MSQYSIYLDDNGVAHVNDHGGWPQPIETAKALIMICQKYIEQNTSESVEAKEREFIATTHPGMYEQVFGEPLPAQFARKPAPRPVKPPKVTYVYIMKDRHTGYCKIGRSNTPKMREGTLQSQKPSIELLCYRKGTAQDENELHLRYQDKRWRGEWFDLSDDDIATLLAEFSAKGGVIPTTTPGPGKGTV